MDVDRFIATHDDEWSRLGSLSRRAQGGARKLSADELDELVRLYQRASTHLSHARATYRDGALTNRLTTLVASANAAIYGGRTTARSAIRRFFAETFPGAVYRLRWFVAASAALTFLPALAVGAFVANSDAALNAAGDEATRAAYVQEDFEDYYSSEPAAQFAGRVTINNIQVSLVAFALGILLCLGTAYVLAFNGANVGVAAGLFYAVGQSPRFWGLILPHGLLELTAVVIAGAAGLRLGWTIVDPGDRTRAAALAEEGRRSMAVVLGLFLAFVLAGLIEGFVTGSGLPTILRVGLGVAVEVTFLVYVYRFGRLADAGEAATT